MIRLLLCTATILVLTVSANAQRESGNYMGGFGAAAFSAASPK
jgi:hypothetical protein